VFIKELSVILQWNNSLEILYLSVTLITSNNSLRCIIIIWASIFPWCLWSSGNMLANIIHIAYLPSLLWSEYSFLTSLSISLLRGWRIKFSRSYNIFSCRKQFSYLILVQEVWCSHFISIKYAMKGYIITHNGLSTFSCKGCKLLVSCMHIYN
jgi:hypothetical protein